MAKSQMFVVDHHPAIPPADLLKAWEDKWFDEEEHADVLLIQAFQAGADQELEACLTEVSFFSSRAIADKVHATRRPKPVSLKKQSIALLDRIQTAKQAWDISELNIIRRALEQLDD